MVAVGHCGTGYCGMLMVIDSMQLVTPAAHQLLFAWAIAGLMALAGAGAAIIPDWDHIGSTVTTAFGPLSLFVHYGVIELHYLVCSVTREPGERKPPGAHRGITHWWPFPPTVGALIAWGCWMSKWTIAGVLFVLFTVAIRGLTIPEYRAKKSDRPSKQFAIGIAYRILNVVPMTRYLRRARKHVNGSARMGGYWTHFNFPTGKICAAIMGVALTYAAFYFQLDNYGPWIGVMVCCGMWLHILGDAPTEMGIPGFFLRRLWRLPKWLAFKAGGAFEIIAVWIPLSVLAVYLTPGLRPHAEVVTVIKYITLGLGSLILLGIIVEFITHSRRMKRRYT